MNKRAQSTIEYFVLICVIVGALVGMQVYFKRGMQGKLKGISEDLSGGEQYSPRATIGYREVHLSINESDESISEDYPGDKNFRIGSSNSWTNMTRGSDKTEELLPLLQEPKRGK